MHNVKRPRGARGREGILSSARSLVIESGYEALTVEGIAAAAGVGKQTLYRWWPSKGALVADAFLDDPAIPPSFASTAPTGDGVAWVRAQADYFSSAVGTSVTRALTSATAEDESVAIRVHERFTAPILAGIIDWLAITVPDAAAGATERQRAAADMLLGALVFRMLTRSEPLSGDGAEEVLHLVLAGLRTAAAR
ncbi:TetR/AcrR family transcriptional regulator [Leifsonia kafniensis]|uniref:TetR/AcrR family transcriptional regulator n=1 Tax=Leifsonia kafniensis TaxID=475957 RepID=A0ABP7K109_9MICO